MKVLIIEDELKDTLLPTFLYGGNIYRPYRQLKFYTSADNQVYKITLRKLLVEKVDLQEGIVINLTETGLEISNTGEPLTCEQEQLFKRFRKIQQSSESLGLGLSIVKSICDFYKMEISYNYRDKMHTMNIKF